MIFGNLRFSTHCVLMINVLVTGLQGLVGNTLAQKLLNHLSSTPQSYKFFSLVRSLDNSSFSLPSRLLSDEILIGDCSSISDLSEALSASTPDVILHLAQMRYVPNLLAALSSTTLNPRLVILGTTGVFSQFPSCSADYKRAETCLHYSKYNFCVLRSSLIYGSKRIKFHKLAKRLISINPLFCRVSTYVFISPFSIPMSLIVFTILL